jgi:hypothetical protein
MSNVWALDLNIEFHKTIKQQWLFGTDGVQPTRVADLPSLRDSNNPNQTKGRRMRAGAGNRSPIATPEYRLRESRRAVSVSLSVANRVPMPKATTG